MPDLLSGAVKRFEAADGEARVADAVAELATRITCVAAIENLVAAV